ncbi:uncharacterized protein [Leptinotarsa decemlineata]|uniref:uncharacterized protein n=1 Tax=Leptinotarsa decemlineata TaxID=7539 RepID=UPI000C255AA6|nr:uncharacterized protein LOC111509366 [Leptinotarsa decemlineata]
MFLLFCLFMLVSSIWAEGISGYKVLENISDRCAKTDDIFKCLKIEAIKVVERALRFEKFNLVDGVSLVSNKRESKVMGFGLNLKETKLEKLDNDQLNDLLGDSTRRFLENYQLEVKMPELETKESELVEEGRKRKNRRRGGNEAMYWALAIKGVFLAVAYKGIAIMSGLSLIMGKMALLLTVILGLKKLVSSGQETTTFEIIKQPKYSESHSHSVSFEDEEKYHHRAYDIGVNEAL